MVMLIFFMSLLPRFTCRDDMFAVKFLDNSKLLLLHPFVSLSSESHWELLIWFELYLFHCLSFIAIFKWASFGSFKLIFLNVFYNYLPTFYQKKNSLLEKIFSNKLLIIVFLFFKSSVKNFISLISWLELILGQSLWALWD